MIKNTFYVIFVGVLKITKNYYILIELEDKMKELLYYPSFFVEDENWIKFALLYLDKVVTIVPTEAYHHLTNTHQLILNETDLLNSHSPNEVEVNAAALKMGNEIDFFINNPINRYMKNSGPFNVNEWQDKGTFTHELFEGKYPYELKKMLTSKNFAKESENGIIINQYLAHIYMTILAHTIAEDKGISTITDIKNKIDFPTLNNLIKNKQLEPKRYKTLIENINIFLPKDINEIELLKIIEFRNHPNNRKALNEFQTAIEKLGLLTRENTSENELMDVKKELFDAKRKYILNIASQFGVGVGSMIGIYQLIKGDAQQLDFLREVLGMGVIQGVRGIYSDINEYNNIRRATSYISNIENLSAGYWNRPRNGLVRNSHLV